MTRCGHTRHVGPCPECQRAQLARWRAQIVEASNAADVSEAHSHPSHIEWKSEKPVVAKRPTTMMCL
jgi:hypothetical protein